MKYTEDYSLRIASFKAALEQAEAVIIGAGAGLSTAAGIEYSGEKFERDYAEYIEKYKFTDLYTSGFYNFPTAEEKWAYWAKHIFTSRIEPGALPLYKELLEVLKHKDYFVLTTNVDGQFELSGFDLQRVFATQGDYLFIQCEVACHDKIYNCQDMVGNMMAQTVDCKVPTELVPVCPVCSEAMDMHLRKDANFVQTSQWYQSARRYEDFAREALKKKTLFLEIGVGYNTPTIIRYPFEQMAYGNTEATLVRINRDEPQAIPENEAKTISFSENVDKIIKDLL